LALVEKAKEYLTTTNLSVAEKAYLPGFEHSHRSVNWSKKKNNFYAIGI
jgi:AraC family transcriptional activator of pobA